jgi:hypothetical protein
MPRQRFRLVSKAVIAPWFSVPIEVRPDIRGKLVRGELATKRFLNALSGSQISLVRPVPEGSFGLTVRWRAIAFRMTLYTRSALRPFFGQVCSTTGTLKVRGRVERTLKQMFSVPEFEVRHPMPSAEDLIERARMFEERAESATDPLSRQHYKEMAAHYRSLSVEHQKITAPSEREPTH